MTTRPLSAEEHDSVLATGLNVLVFRVAESPACQAFQPELDEFVRRRPDRAVWTVEAMEQRDLADLHGLRALPSIVIYRDGLPARRFAGSMSADDLVEEVDEVAAADMRQEHNDWMLDLLETGEAGSPYVNAPSTTRPSSPGPSPVERTESAQSTFPGRTGTAAQSMMSAAQPTIAGAVAEAPAVDHLEACNDAWYAGDAETAVHHFNAVLAKDPDSMDALSGRGQILADTGAGRSALADLNRILSLYPEAAYVRSARALALATVGGHEEADADMASALQSTPDNAWAHLRQAGIHLIRENRPEARTFLVRALESNNPPLTAHQRKPGPGSPRRLLIRQARRPVADRDARPPRADFLLIHGAPTLAPRCARTVPDMTWVWKLLSNRDRSVSCAEPI